MLFLALLIALFLSSCQSLPNSKVKSCQDCHGEILKTELKVKEHNLSCILCHGGKEQAITKDSAHKNLVKSPSPDRVFSVCGKCHWQEAKGIAKSLHYTHQKKVNFLLARFGLGLKASSLSDLFPLSENNSLDEKSKLVLDFLGKRCFTCHIFYEGEDYELTHRGKGCLACHRVHTYEKPRNKECLSCHYSIRVGMDYLGKAPHNWFVDYRSPFIEGKLPPRPYGIEYYDLKADVHASHGFSCTNCHGKEEIMYSMKRASCLDCHKKVLEDRLIFHKKSLLQKVSCAVCHASFINQDEYKACELVRNDEDAEKFSEVYVQESSDIERYFLSLWERKKPLSAMRDGLIGRLKDGLWLCFLENRTFERVNLGKDKDGKLCIMRKEKVKITFDNETVFADLSVCKFPHTIRERANPFRSLEVIKNELSKGRRK